MEIGRLVLSFKEGESVFIDIGGERVASITVADIRGSQVKLVFRAPSSIQFQRSGSKKRPEQARVP